MIGCIFAENGPLEGGIDSSFWGTGWGAKGDFRRIFGPDPFIFEGSSNFTSDMEDSSDFTSDLEDSSDFTSDLEISL